MFLPASLMQIAMYIKSSSIKRNFLPYTMTSYIAPVSGKVGNTEREKGRERERETPYLHHDQSLHLRFMQVFNLRSIAWCVCARARWEQLNCDVRGKCNGVCGVTGMRSSLI